MTIQYENITASFQVENPWKACNLRGIYPDEIFPSLYQDIGSAIGSILSLFECCRVRRLST
jgi:hypothetical protein